MGVFAIAGAETINFDDATPGASPSGWTATQTGKGAARWTIEKDDTAPSKPNVLKQSAEATYPVCLKNETSIKDGFVEVKFKPLSGKEDQAGGVIWRAKDADNYYIARANALEDNVTIYHTIKGKRTEKKRAKLNVTRCARTSMAIISPSPSMARRPLSGRTTHSRSLAWLVSGRRPTA
jgi:hypothetical protein